MKAKELQAIVCNWANSFISKGIEDKFSRAYMGYVTSLLSKGVPPIFDFKHLCKLLAIKPEELAAMINGTDGYYRTFEIPKRSGGTRTITAPYPSLKYVQKWISCNILNQGKVHGCAHGFIEKRSILTNVKVHQNQKYLLKIDLKDFFSSIPISWVIQLFKDLGYEQQVAFYLAALCCHQDVLPQGSPASPVISNLVAMHLDRRLYRLAKHFQLNYSRYADDIAFSGNEIPIKFIEYVSAIITDCGLTVNPNKIRLYGEHGSKILTGISLATGTPKLPREYRRSLEKELYYIEKYGFKGHISHNKIRKSNYLVSMLGKVNYWLMIEPENDFAQRMRVKLWEEYRMKSGNGKEMDNDTMI